jgi:predicted DsbA family dithiol-disulfide isomerase
MGIVKINHFSDVLCVWAYVSQVRCDELCERFGESVSIDWRYIHVFGSVHEKMRAQWEAQGGIAAYGQHVKEVAAKFDHVAIHPKVWVENTPESSMPSHLYLCAVRTLVEAGEVEPDAVERAAWSIRT